MKGCKDKLSSQAPELSTINGLTEVEDKMVRLTLLTVLTGQASPRESGISKHEPQSLFFFKGAAPPKLNIPFLAASPDKRLQQPVSIASMAI